MTNSKEKNHYYLIQEKILQQLLDGKNLSLLSRRMGFSFNKILRWKQNKKNLKWNEFVDLCNFLKFPLTEMMVEIFGISIRNTTDLKNSTVKILASLSDQRYMTAKLIGKSLPTLHRIRSKKSAVDFISVLALMDQRPKYLEKFQEELVSRTASLKNPKIPLNQSIFSCPWFGLVSSAMALKEHQNLPSHSDQWIADKTGLSIAEVKIAIELLLTHQLIEKKGPHYAPTFSRTLAISQHQSPSDFNKALHYWTERAVLECVKPQNEASKSFFRSFATNPETAQAITDLMLEYEEKIHNLLVNAKGEKTELRYLVFHHLLATKQP